MTDRSTALLLIAVGLVGYGVYTAAYVPAMLMRPPAPLLALSFVLQVVCALIAAVGVWRRQSWAGGAVMLLGASIALTALVEAFVLGIVASLHALLVAVLAIVLAFIVAAYVNRADG